MTEKMHFKNKVIWITGASSGIGEGLSKRLAKDEAKLILTARNEAALNVIREDCLKDTRYCTTLPADLTHADNLESLTRQALSIYGHVDITIHSAGVSQRSFAIDTDMLVYRKLMEINFFAPVALTKYILPHFFERKTGHVVVISSMAALMGFPLRSGYVAAKHALHGFFETLQVEKPLPGFTITIVSPGRIHTPISLSALTADGQAHNQMDEGQLNGIPVNTCVEKIVKAMKHRKKHIIIARSERLLWRLWWYCPPLYYRIAHKAGLPAT